MCVCVCAWVRTCVRWHIHNTSLKRNYYVLKTLEDEHLFCFQRKKNRRETNKDKFPGWRTSNGKHESGVLSDQNIISQTNTDHEEKAMLQKLEHFRRQC